MTVQEFKVGDIVKTVNGGFYRVLSDTPSSYRYVRVYDLKSYTVHELYDDSLTLVSTRQTPAPTIKLEDGFEIKSGMVVRTKNMYDRLYLMVESGGKLIGVAEGHKTILSLDIESYLKQYATEVFVGSSKGEAKLLIKDVLTAKENLIWSRKQSANLAHGFASVKDGKVEIIDTSTPYSIGNIVSLTKEDIKEVAKLAERI